jgi:hypothetical protein
LKHTSRKRKRRQAAKEQRGMGELKRKSYLTTLQEQKEILDSFRNIIFQSLLLTCERARERERNKTKTVFDKKVFNKRKHTYWK